MILLGLSMGFTLHFVVHDTPTLHHVIHSLTWYQGLLVALTFVEKKAVLSSQVFRRQIPH
jgi:hypothetical protein